LKYYPNFSILVETWRNYELSLHQFLGESTARVNTFSFSQFGISDLKVIILWCEFAMTGNFAKMKKYYNMIG